MEREFKKNRKIKWTALAVFTAGALVGGVSGIPVQAQKVEAYKCTLNGEEVGIISSGQMLNNALGKVRVRLSQESGTITYLDAEYSLEPVEASDGQLMKEEALEEAVYHIVHEEKDVAKQKAYTIKIGQFTVTVATKDEAMAIFEKAKEPYDKYNEFEVELIENTTKDLAGYTATLTRRNSFSENIAELQAGIANVTETGTAETDPNLLSLSFAENIEIVETYVNQDQIVSLEEAIASVTKEKEKNKIYEVVAGDCLSIIADKTETSMDRIIALNELSGTDAMLHAGDELIVTVPEPELSVMMDVLTTYEESYTKVEYIDNDSWYTTREEVRQEGSEGHHRVTDQVTYQNGIEVGRSQIGEEVLAECVPRVIERGTIIPPTYIKPLSNGRLTSGFKMRWGRMHRGVDWACPIGTAIKASCSGKVVQAGWSGTYGYCVTLSHADGRKTRYAHLSKILVSVGQSVKQGEKIALSGNTGNSTGPHVHFEIHINGTRVNPLDYLD